MDKSQPSHGRDGKISHSTYGSRDKGGSQGMDRTARMTTADRMMRDAEKKFLKHMSNADKVKKGWRNPNIDEGMDDTVAFEIDSENAYNHVMKRFGSVIDWDGDAMVVPRRYWPAVQEVAHDAGGAATEYGTEGMAEGFPHDVDHMPGPRIKNPQTGCKRCHGKGYVYKTADGKVLPSNEQGAKRYKCGACGGIGFVKQGVAEVSDETLTSYLSKVHADSQKHDRDPSKRSPAKRNKSVQGFSRAFNKLDARKSQTDEGLADDFMKLAQARGINARLRGTPEQERARSQQILAQRAKDRAAQPAPEGPSPERRAELQAKLKELEAQFDPNYEYSDDHSFWSRQHALAQQIQGIRQQLSITEISKQKLGDYLHAAHQDVVDRASSSSFQSGQAGDRYNRADVSPKERQRQAGMQRAITRLTREGSSMAEAWARRYPNINADIAECKSSGDGERLKRLMSIKDIIDSDLREQSGLGFGE